jgi:hypothetical protein
MTRLELIRRLVLNEICDDYEDIFQIEKQLGQGLQDVSFSISQEEVIRALAELIELEWARAWDLSSNNPEVLPYDGMPPTTEIVPWRTYFWATPTGIAINVADDSWSPWNDEGSVRPSWNPPEA